MELRAPLIQLEVIFNIPVSCLLHMDLLDNQAAKSE